ncbi:unnamed protein product [Heligmosomoides polygyrus]|uniref:Integrase catalytic domain-containing protein n=1 Tax=Heligmosomoides polygyrus TaxID=6339 RepID=A0A183G886_HELPZ|nr:unnamed protein product [Heligmosomoides polygyrus]
MDELAKVAGIERSTTKGYDSRANGACERAIGTLQRILKKKVDRPDYWDNWNDRNREAVDSGSEALENCGRPEKEGRGCIGLIKAQKWADVEDPRGVVMVVPLALRALKRLRGFRNTTVFYYRSFWDINPGRTMLFEGRARHVILVFPSGNAGIGAWSPLVDAVGMWMAGGATIYLVAGPRPIADAAWAEVAELARKQIDTYIRPEYRGKIVDKFPLRGATVDWKAPCFALGIVEDTEGVLSERQARVFYAACAQQLEPCLQMEPLPNKDHGVGIGLAGNAKGNAPMSFEECLDSSIGGEDKNPRGYAEIPMRIVEYPPPSSIAAN